MSQTHERPDRGSTPGIPRWVKVFGIVALSLVLLLVVLMLIGGGEHGPGRHIPTGDPRGYTMPIEQRVQQS